MRGVSERASSTQQKENDVEALTLAQRRRQGVRQVKAERVHEHQRVDGDARRPAIDESAEPAVKRHADAALRARGDSAARPRVAERGARRQLVVTLVASDGVKVAGDKDRRLWMLQTPALDVLAQHARLLSTRLFDGDVQVRVDVQQLDVVARRAKERHRCRAHAHRAPVL